MAHLHNPTTKMRRWNFWDCIVHKSRREVEEGFKLKGLEIWLNENSFAKGLNFGKFWTLTCKSCCNSCRTHPLFIGDENWLKRAKRFVGGNPNTKQIRKIAVGICQQILTVVGRPGRSTANGRIFVRWESGRPGRSTEVPNREWVFYVGRPRKNREHCSCSRSTGPVDRCAHMHNGACRSTDPVDRTRPKNRFLKGLFEERNFDKNSLDGYIENIVLGLIKNRVWS